jgi:hypothetical protein
MTMKAKRLILAALLLAPLAALSAAENFGDLTRRLFRQFR